MSVPSQNNKEMDLPSRRGVMLVLSSPSGAGKTTIARQVLERDDNISISVSATTRNRRSKEIDGEDYYFMDEDKFKQEVAEKNFLEHAHVFGNYYGTPKEPVYKELVNGKDVLFDIDWQGTEQLTKVASKDLVSIFVLPPSWEELENRLKKRGQDSDEVIKSRMSKAVDEMAHYDQYNYVIVNHDLEDSINRVQSILRAERMKRRRLSGLSAFVAKLRPEII